MTQITDIEAFRTQLSGTALIQGDNGYDEARSAWNGGIDRYPAVIARCESAADVAAAIGFARQHTLEISVRGGFHNTAGMAICEGGLMIDLSPLRRVAVDPATRRRGARGSAAVPPWAIWTPPPRCTAWRCRRGSSATLVWAVSHWVAGWGG